jgi:hypothetical protein
MVSSETGAKDANHERYQWNYNAGLVIQPKETVFADVFGLLLYCLAILCPITAREKKMSCNDFIRKKKETKKQEYPDYSLQDYQNNVL